MDHTTLRFDDNRWDCGATPRRAKLQLAFTGQSVQRPRRRRFRMRKRTPRETSAIPENTWMNVPAPTGSRCAAGGSGDARTSIAHPNSTSEYPSETTTRTIWLPTFDPTNSYDDEE